LNTALARRAVIAARHARSTLLSTNWPALEKAAVRTADGALGALAASTLTSLELKVTGLARSLAPEDTSHFAVREAYLAVRAVAANSPAADAGRGGQGEEGGEDDVLEEHFCGEDAVRRFS
jgi:hypothetical protein